MSNPSAEELAPVTVIVPTRANGRGLVRACDSALAQRGAEATLIVVVDGLGADATEVAYLEELGDQHLVLNLPTVGRVAVLRNVGLALCRTPFVAFLDDDDWWREDKLKRQLALAVSTGASTVISNATRVVLGEPDGPYHRELPGTISLEALIHTNWVITSSVLCRTESLRAVGGFPVNDAIRSFDDWAAWLRLAMAAPIQALPDRLLCYTAGRPDSLSRTSLSGEEARCLVLDDFLGWSARSGSTLPLRIRRLARRLTVQAQESDDRD